MTAASPTIWSFCAARSKPDYWFDSNASNHKAFLVMDQDITTFE